MRIKIAFVTILALGIFAPVRAQSTPKADAYADLEPITLENASRLVQLPGELTGVSAGFDVSPDGKLVAVARPDGVYLYDMDSFESPAKVFKVKGADKVYGPQFSPDGTRLTISTIGLIPEGQLTQLWDVEHGTLIQTFESGYPLAGGASFSPDGRIIAGYDTSYYTCPPGAACDTMSMMWAWAIDAPDTPYCYGYNCIGRYGVGGFAFTPDSQTLLWSALDYSGTEVRQMQYFWIAVDLSPIEANPDGNKIPEISDGLKSHIDDQTGPFAGDISSVWFSPDGTFLVVHNDADKTDSLWDVDSGDLKLSLLAGTDVSGFMPDDAILMQDDNQHRAILLGIDTGRQTTLLKNLGEQAYISTATPDGRLLVGWQNFETIHFYGVPAESKSTL
jgi:WD40 repeat protein